MFAFTGKEHQAVFVAGLLAVALGCALVAVGAVHWSWLVASYVVANVYLLAGRVGFHSLFCHASFKTSRVFSLPLLLIATLGCYGSSIHFTLSHIWHHRHADTEDDPQQFATWRDVFLPSYVERPAGFADRRMVYRRIGKYPEHRIAHDLYWLIVGVVALLLLLIDWRLALYVWAIPAGVTIFAGRVFNYLGHDGMDRPTNVWWWSFIFPLGGGEWLHDNHHRRPGEWDYRNSPWQWEPGAFLIWLIMKDRPSFKSFITLKHKAV